MRSLYDNLGIGDSVAPASATGSTAINGAVVDTKGYNSALLRAYAVAASGSPTTAKVTFKLQEGAKSDASDMADALDNSGAVISTQVTVTSVDKEVLSRIEGLGLNRKRYLRVVATPAFTSGTSPASLVFGEILLGRAYNKPTNTAVSNT